MVGCKNSDVGATRGQNGSKTAKWMVVTMTVPFLDPYYNTAPNI